MRYKKLILPVAATILIGGVTLSLAKISDNDADRIDAIEPAGPGPLDGMTFVGMLGPSGKPKDVADTFVFESGTFVSRECETRCDYPARAYHAQQTETGWNFSSTTRCPYKDAKIEWRGTVEGDTVSGLATWTIKRWYWTVERDFTFKATLQATPEPSAGNS